MRRAVLTTLVLAACAGSLSAQESKQINIPFDGPDFFCHVLFSKGLTPLASFDEAVENPRDSMVILFGFPTVNVTAFVNKSLKKYRDAGGNLMMATDRSLSIEELGVRISGIPVSRSDREECFAEVPRCPWLSYDGPAVEGFANPRGHPLFGLLQNRIASNCPSNLRVQPGAPLQAMIVMRSFKKEFRPPPFGQPGEFRLPPPPAYMACSPKDAPSAGRALILAGHGLFINGMMLHPDTDNLSFAINAVEWLRDGPRGQKRTKALFILDGQVISNFDRNLAPPPPPIPVPTVAMLNRLVRGLEDEGFFHIVFRHVLGNHYDRAVPFLLSLVTCVLLLYGAKKVLEGRSAPDTAVPRAVGAATASERIPPRSLQRQAAMHQQKDAWEEARLLADLWLQSACGIGVDEAGPEHLIDIQVSGSIWSRWRLRRHANFLLELIHSAEPFEVSRSQFAAFVRALPVLCKAVHDGRLALLLDGKEVRKTTEPEA